LNRQQCGAHAEALLQVGHHAGHWLVFQRTITDLDRELVDPLGGEWQKVEQVGVAVAVPLDDEGRPGKTTCPRPLHVYFPTTEGTGLPVTLHGDFALDLDRRRVATGARNAPPQPMARGSACQPARGSRRLSRAAVLGDASVVTALAPAGHPDGFGEYVHHQCMHALRSARFVPVTGGHAAAPWTRPPSAWSARKAGWAGPKVDGRSIKVPHGPRSGRG
jgi:hypothetical protein